MDKQEPKKEETREEKIERISRKMLGLMDVAKKIEEDKHE